MKQNPRLVNALGLMWLWCYATLLYAAPSFSQDVKAYDYESLGWGMAAALLGGTARTILTLASDRVAVLNLASELRKDAIVALIGGAVGYVILQWLTTSWPATFNSEVRMLAILGIGFSRGKWMTAVGKLTDDIFANLRNRARGTAPEDITPATAPMPLDTPK